MSFQTRALLSVFFLGFTCFSGTEPATMDPVYENFDLRINSQSIQFGSCIPGLVGLGSLDRNTLDNFAGWVTFKENKGDSGSYPNNPIQIILILVLLIRIHL